MSAHNDGLPEDAAGMNLMLHALIDGELDAAAAMAVERRGGLDHDQRCSGQRRDAMGDAA
ncbi:hypothetical protein X750_24590 [Mesorhizobium sp. LNJC394B00]|nr:hypothetical protein X750_24590 [Mesorhizobium sp. LNJC394B00]